MPPTRGHDLKQGRELPREEIAADAPHTGARLETTFRAISRPAARMPPTRGHDLKLIAHCCAPFFRDAPHTGARLETTGILPLLPHTMDAPHTGARLETYLRPSAGTDCPPMPPTRGHDLKRRSPADHRTGRRMPPTRGHDLKLDEGREKRLDDRRMPPTRGHDLKP